MNRHLVGRRIRNFLSDDLGRITNIENTRFEGQGSGRNSLQEIVVIVIGGFRVQPDFIERPKN